MKFIDSLKETTWQDVMWLVVVVVVFSAALPKLLDLAVGLFGAVKAAVA